MRDDDWEMCEERYHTIRRQYKEEGFKIFPELLGVLASGCTLERQTPEAMKIFWVSFIWTWMRQTSVTVSILRRWPYRVMARLMGIDTTEKLEKQRFVSLLEPCCGSGANLLAFAEHIADSGKVPTLHMETVVVDIDVLCVWMCFVQYHFYGIPAKIIHGDSIKNEFQTAWRTVHWLRGGFEDEMKAEIDTDKIAAFDTAQHSQSETKITVVPLLNLEEQLVLF